MDAAAASEVVPNENSWPYYESLPRLLQLVLGQTADDGLKNIPMI